LILLMGVFLSLLRLHPENAADRCGFLALFASLAVLCGRIGPFCSPSWQKLQAVSSWGSEFL